MEVFQKITVQNKVAHLHSKKFYWGMYFSELSPHGHKESLLDWTGTSVEFSYLTPTAVTGSAWLFLNILEKISKHYSKKENQSVQSGWRLVHRGNNV